MGFFSDKCPECGGVVRKGASFCPHCGEPAPKADIICSSCGAKVRAGAQFCGRCGARLRPADSADAPVDEMNRWKRAPDEFARRIEASHLRGLLRRGLVVESDVQALVFQGGALAGVVSAGTYDLSRPMQGVDAATPATAIVMDAGETAVGLLYRDVRTAEEIPVDVAVEVVVGLSDPEPLHANLMHGRRALSLADLADFLRESSANVVESCVRKTPAADLASGLEVKSELEGDLRANLAAALQRNGLDLVELRQVDVSSDDYDKLRARRAKTALAEEKIENAERRAALRRRLRETLTKDKMDQFASDRDYEQFIRQTEHELGMKDVIRQEEMEELKRTYRQRKEDAETARRHLLEKLELEERLARLGLEQQMDDRQMQHRLEQQRQELEARQEAEWKEIVQHKKMGDVERETMTADAMADLEIKRKKVQLGMEARRQKIDLDNKEASQQAALEQEAKDREAARELERLRELSRQEQERLAADLKKTEVMKDMSEDQILALMAKDSPFVGQAIAERAKAQAESGASADVKALYEKVVAAKEGEADRLERVMGKAMESMERVAGGAAARQREQTDQIQEMASDSMDRMADVAGAKAGASGGSAPEAANVLCPKCRQQAAAGSKFCDNCGHRFFE